MRRDGAPPLSPSGGTAHDWLQRELSKPAYADQRSWLDRLWDWATDRLHDLLHGVGGALPLYVLIPLLLVIAALVILGATRLRRRGATTSDNADDGVLTDVDLSAEQLRQRAARSSQDGAHSAAFVDYFRAIARRAEERTLLLPRPGRTAHEVAFELSPYFPTYGAGIHSAARFFDSVRYGDTVAGVNDVAQLVALDRDLDGTRPHHAAALQVTP